MTATMTPATQPTTDQIKALRSEAGVAGDSRQVELCDRALRGDLAALAACARAIAAARAAAE